MTHTIEDIRRLVPEAKALVQFKDGAFGFEIDGIEYLSDEPPVMKFISTRAQLEVAVEALESIGNASLPGNRISMAKEALAKIQELSK